MRRVLKRFTLLDLKDVEALADTLFDKADADKSGTISFNEFYSILKPFTNNLEIKLVGRRDC